MKAEDKIYKAFLETQSKLYYNQLKKTTRLSHSSLQNALNSLSNNKILKQEKTKSNVFYRINDKKMVSLKFSEIAINKFNNLNIGVRVPLRNFLKNIPKSVFTVVIFGSASRKEERDDSDIDILVVANKNLNLEQKKKDAETTSKHPINIFKCNVDKFIKNNDDVIIQARKTGFPIYKEQNFYEVLLDEY